MEALGVAWDAVAEQWERMHGLLAAYVEREGHARVPTGHVEDGERLGVWLAQQRRAFKKGLLLPDRAARLEALGVVWDVFAEQWERSFALLQAFVAREGHANVPQRHVEDGQRLGGWLSKQRTRHQLRTLSEAERRKKKVSALSDLEVQRLEALGVVWRLRS